jgi:hypothetical protein
MGIQNQHAGLFSAFLANPLQAVAGEDVNRHRDDEDDGEGQKPDTSCDCIISS